MPPKLVTFHCFVHSNGVSHAIGAPCHVSATTVTATNLEVTVWLCRHQRVNDRFDFVPTVGLSVIGIAVHRQLSCVHRRVC